MNEARKIGEYTVLESFRIGEYEIALCERPEAPQGEVFLCGYIERNAFFEKLTDCLVSDSYAEIAVCYGERIKEKSEAVQRELERIKKEIGEDAPITAKDCDHVSTDECLVNKIIVIRGDILRPEYNRASNQLLLCTGGFGAQPNARGRTCFGTRLYDAYKTEYQRNDILGVMPEEKLPVWAKNSLQAIRAKNMQVQKKKDTRGER